MWAGSGVLVAGERQSTGEQHLQGQAQDPTTAGISLRLDCKTESRSV